MVLHDRFEGMKVAVAGASGGVGKAIVERLVLDGVATRALVRDPYAAVGAYHCSWWITNQSSWCTTT